MSSRGAAASAIRTAACAAAVLWLLVPASAHAALTLRVEGLEASLNDAWSREPDCAQVRVNDLVRRGESLAITTSTPLIVSLFKTAPDQPLCEAQGWQIRALHGSDSKARTCARSVCQLLLSNVALARGLDGAWERSGKEKGEAPPPRRWKSPSPSIPEVVWFVDCAITLLLLLLLAALRGRLRNVAPHVEEAPDWPVIGVIALASLAIHALIAARAPILIDESFFFGRDSFWREFGEYETVMNPPFYRLLSLPVSLWTQGAPGPGRLVPVLLGGTLVVIMGRLGTVLAGRPAGVAAATLAAFHPGLLMATVYHRAYAALVTTTALSLLLVVTALRTKRGIDRYLAAIALAAVFESHYFGAAVILGAIIWILVEERGRAIRWLGPASLLVVLCAPLAAAALVGAHQKERLGVNASTALHGRGLAESLPAVLAGVIRPELQEVLYTRHSGHELWLGGLILAVALFLGVTRLGRRTGVGLLAVVMTAALVPVVLSFLLVTVREFQAIAAAVPVVAVVAAAFSKRSQRQALLLSAIPGLLFLTRLPLSASSPAPADLLARAIMQDKAHWPVFVWAADEHGYTDVALRVGLSLPAADERIAGHDNRIRALRSCSTAAVREASRALQRPSVRVLLSASPCAPEDLAGNGVACTIVKSPAEGADAIDCQVDPSQSLWPVEGSRELLDGVIPPGMETLFVEAASPLRLGEPDAAGTRLSRITINAQAVQFELLAANGARVALVASPSVVEGHFVGTNIAVEGDPVPAELRKSVGVLSSTLQTHLTPDVWREVYVPDVTGRNGKTPLHLPAALAVSAFAGLVLLGALRRDATSK